MKRELIGVLASLVLGAGVAAAQSSDEARKSTLQPRKTKPAPRSSPEAQRQTHQALQQVAIARRALDRDDPEAADAALEKAERNLQKLHGGPRIQTMLDEVDDVLRRLDAEPHTGGEPVDLGPLSAMIKANRAWIDPQVTAKVAEADRKSSQGDFEGASEALRTARGLLAADASQHTPIEDTFMRVLAARRALDENDPARAQRLLSGIPHIPGVGGVPTGERGGAGGPGAERGGPGAERGGPGAERGGPGAERGGPGAEEPQATGTPMVPVRTKLDAAANAVDEGNWKQAANLLQQANRDVREIARTTRDEPFAEELQSLSEELDTMEQQIANGAEPSARKIREMSKKAKQIGGGEG